MDMDLSIDVGSVIPYAIDKFLSIFGRDALSVSAKNRWKQRIEFGVEESRFVQCIGMSAPIPIENIYQPTRLRKMEYSKSGPEFSISDVLKQKNNTVIWGAPGSGKSIFLRSCYVKLLCQEEYISILFTLRSPNAISDLISLVEDLEEKYGKKFKDRKLVLLVDGYDEVSPGERKDISQALKKFSTLKIGFFILTCRLYYEIVDLSAHYWWIDSFSEADAQEYVRAFSEAYSFPIDSVELIEELKERGFSDFLASPLMLTLVCILKSGPFPSLPKNTIGLIRRAIDTLTIRWDASRGIGRECDVAIDGEERIRCLMKIAFNYKQPIGDEATALRLTSEHLNFIKRNDINSLQLLLEIAKWYGLFVPSSEGAWTFTHRAIHDFLAARQWVESGDFSRTPVTSLSWNTRTAYAACLNQDASDVMARSLLGSRDIHIYFECINNKVPFNGIAVAKALIGRYGGLKYGAEISYKRNYTGVWIVSPHDLLGDVSNDFLFELLRASKDTNGRGYDIIYGLAVRELIFRKLTAGLIEADCHARKEIYFYVSISGKNRDVFNQFSLVE